MSTVRRGSCEHCWVTFDYCLYHLQWDRLRCGYCERCGCAKEQSPGHAASLAAGTVLRDQWPRGERATRSGRRRRVDLPL